MVHTPHPHATVDPASLQARRLALVASALMRKSPGHGGASAAEAVEIELPGTTEDWRDETDDDTTDEANHSASPPENDSASTSTVPYSAE